MSMKLFILGLLMEKDRHPYEIRETIKQRNWNMTFKLRDGSLYYAVDQLRADGLIEAAEVIPVPGESRPDKTVYRITEQGKAAFLDLMVTQMEHQAYPQHPMFAAMPFVMHADPDKVIELAEKQLAACECRIGHLRDVLEIKKGMLPPGSRLMIEGVIRFSEAERGWLADLIAQAGSGRLFGGKAKNDQGSVNGA